uniref:Uncharacterized protein n=1 Tax=Oryza glumipatula TaxID=40148 RepID=A0A0D9ZR85_9ORYZ
MYGCRAESDPVGPQVQNPSVWSSDDGEEGTDHRAGSGGGANREGGSSATANATPRAREVARRRRQRRCCQARELVFPRVRGADVSRIHHIVAGQRKHHETAQTCRRAGESKVQVLTNGTGFLRVEKLPHPYQAP